MTSRTMTSYAKVFAMCAWAVFSASLIACYFVALACISAVVTLLFFTPALIIFSVTMFDELNKWVATHGRQIDTEEILFGICVMLASGFLIFSSCYRRPFDVTKKVVCAAVDSARDLVCKKEDELEVENKDA